MSGRDVVAALFSFTPLAFYFANGFFVFTFQNDSCIHPPLQATASQAFYILLPWAELGSPVVLTRLFKSACKSAFIAGPTPDVQTKLWYSLWVVGLN